VEHRAFRAVVVPEAVIQEHTDEQRQRGRSKHPRVEDNPDDAAFWDSPGTVISYVKMAAAVSGTRPDIGENREVAL
jgi:hypothetical protein